MLIGLMTAVSVALLIFFTLRARWRYKKLLATVEVVRLPKVVSRFLDNSRHIDIYLPPGYRRDPSQPAYKTLYINDGQDMEQLRLRETLATLYARDRLQPIVVVAIPANADRLQEYGTAVAPNAQGLGAKAALYNRFVTQELMPLIQQEFHVSEHVLDTAVLGASLGGLSAFDLAWNYPDIFGKVGVFSGSFWWRAAEDETRVPPNQLIAPAIVRQSQYRPAFRGWFEVGARDELSDRDNNGVIDAIQDTLELIDDLVALGYRRDADVMYVEVENGRHDWPTWAEALPEFLCWAFPKKSPQTRPVFVL